MLGASPTVTNTLRQLVPGSPNPYYPALHPSLARGSQPGRPLSQRRRTGLEGEPESSHSNGKGVDREVCKGIVHRDGNSIMVKDNGVWLSTPIKCDDPWFIALDDDEGVFASYDDGGDARVMVSD